MILENFVVSGFDSKVTAAFAKRQLDVLNSVALCLVVSLGHRRGLFDVLRDTASLLPSPRKLEPEQDCRNAKCAEWFRAMGETLRKNTSVKGGLIPWRDF